MKKEKQTTTVTTVTTLPAIKDYRTSNNQGIILIDQKAMQDVFTKSGPNAKTNEFQVHYWAVNYRHKASDGSILDICVPTVYFNYKQKVTSAHIDFELSDVKELSTALEPVHNMYANKLIELGLKESLESALGISLVSSPSHTNSIHRHPGSSNSQSFSGTDLCKTAAEPGVVYPLQTGEDTPNFAGIMAIDSGVCNVAHYEYRIANGTLGTDIEYLKGRCAALMVAPDSQPSAIESVMGIKQIPQSYSKLDSCEFGDVLSSIYRVAYDLFVAKEFTPFTDAVDPTNVTTAPVTTYNYGWGGNTTTATDINKKYKDHQPRYKTLAQLDDLSVYELNEMYKGMYYAANKTIIKTYYTSKLEAKGKVTEMQVALKLTADQPYGPNFTGYKFWSDADYKAATTWDLRQQYKDIICFFNEPNDSKAHLKDHKDMLDIIGELRMKHDKKSPATDNDDQSLIDFYSDIKFIDTEDTAACIRLGVETLVEHLNFLELKFYGDMAYDPTTIATVTDLKTLISEIAQLQEFIEGEIDDARASIAKQTTPPTLQELQTELIGLGAIESVVMAMPYDSLESMLSKIK